MVCCCFSFKQFFVSCSNDVVSPQRFCKKILILLIHNFSNVQNSNFIILTGQVKSKAVMACSLSLSAIFIVFIAQASANDWQVFGEFKVEELSKIYQLADNAIKKAPGLSAVPKLISEGLGRQWGNKWNVVILVPKDDTADAVIYGEAYESHWMWLNNFNNHHFALIIWVDKECPKWTTVNSDTNTPPANQYPQIAQQFQKLLMEGDYFVDPWKLAFDFQVQTGNIYQNIVIMNGAYRGFYAQVCEHNQKRTFYTVGWVEDELTTFSYLFFKRKM